MCEKVYIIKWAGTGRMHYEFHTDLKRAEEHVTQANKRLSWWHRLTGDRWILCTLRRAKNK